MPQNNSPSLYELTGLAAAELAEVLARNPRSYMAVKGAVAEKHLEKILVQHRQESLIKDFRAGEGDFDKDFYITLPDDKVIALECKTIEVLKAQTKKLATYYLLYLVRNGYVGIEDILQIIATNDVCRKLEKSSSYKDFQDVDSLEEYLNSQYAKFVQTVKKSLPIEFKSSGMARYNFSKDMLLYKSIEDADRETFLRQFDEYPLTIDFQRTRNTADEDSGKDKNRLYRLGEIDAVAACLFARTKKWEFIYATTEHFEVHNTYFDRYRKTLRIHPEHWSTSFRRFLKAY